MLVHNQVHHLQFQISMVAPEYILYKVYADPQGAYLLDWLDWKERKSPLIFHIFINLIFTDQHELYHLQNAERTSFAA